jgi:hypothetical protein
MLAIRRPRRRASREDHELLLFSISHGMFDFDPAEHGVPVNQAAPARRSDPNPNAFFTESANEA